MKKVILFTGMLALVIGCGKDVQRSTVRGTVKYQGKPLTNAAVVFIASDNKTHPLDIQPDGSYTVTGVAQGTVKVAVQPEPEQAASSRPIVGRGSGDEAAKDKARLPARDPAVKSGPPLNPKYADADKSGLTFELNQAEQEWSVDLK